MIDSRIVFAGLAMGLAATAAHARVFNQYGNLLISDQFNNRVIEVSPPGKIVWSYGVGPRDHSGASPIGVNDAVRVANLTLISATGAPAGSEPGCPEGCVDSRVLLVNRQGEIVWQYGTFGVAGSGPDQLDTPVQAACTRNNTILIADQANQRIIEVNLRKKIIWQYGTTGVGGSGPNHLQDPNSAELLDNGDVLIADENNNRVIEVNRAKTIVATFTIGGTASGVAFASRLPNGDTLITDANNNRVVEVDSADNTVWSYTTNTEVGSNPNPAPSRAVRLRFGRTIISDQFNDRVIVVNPAGQIVAQYGNLNAAGFGKRSTQAGLNAPYDAKLIGDDTGLSFVEPGAVIQHPWR